jgi:hypothetical protein
MAVKFANSSPELIAVFCRWLQRFFAVDETRLRVVLYLLEELDLDVATTHWAHVTDIPPAQFSKPYRAVADTTVRRTKHVHGGAHVELQLLADPADDPGDDRRDAARRGRVRGWLRGWDSNPQTFRLTADCSAS